MNDQDLKNLFKSMDHGEPSELDMSRWKKAIRRELDRTPSEWMRLAAACLLGVLIGAAAMKNHQITKEKFDEDATVERVYVNLD